MRIGYLGPPGTFTEEALLSIKPLKEEDLISYSTEKEVLKAVEEGEVAKGIVPIENSIEGTVNITLDTLTFETNLLIEKEVVTAVRHNLIVPAEVNPKEIEQIISHPQATAQCRNYLNQNFPNVPIEAANSTAEAVKKVAEIKEKVAAIGTKLAARLYNLEILAEGIEDYKDNQTRFVLVGKEEASPTGKDKTSVACFIYEDKPGSLLQVLSEFANRYINLTKIQSRPTKKALGEYYFWIDLEGHLEEKKVSEAIEALEKKIREVKVLGSYPRA